MINNYINIYIYIYRNSIVFSYLYNTCLLKKKNTSVNVPKEINSKFSCDPEKFIHFLGPYFNKKVLNPFFNQKWEETLKNLKDYSNLVDSKNLKPVKNNSNYYIII